MSPFVETKPCSFWARFSVHSVCASTYTELIQQSLQQEREYQNCHFIPIINLYLKLERASNYLLEKAQKESEFTFIHKINFQFPALVASLLSWPQLRCCQHG